jgi:hypothetical protein
MCLFPGHLVTTAVLAEFGDMLLIEYAVINAVRLVEVLHEELVIVVPG